MKQITPKQLIDFRRKTTKAKKNFIENLKTPKIERASPGGGDYWISCISTISKFYTIQDLSIIDDKIILLNNKIKDSPAKITKNMFQRNIDILNGYTDFDYQNNWPVAKIEFLKKSNLNPILTIKGFEILIKPHHVFTFKENNTEYIGVICFVAKLNGYRIEETGLYTELLHKYLKNNYDKKYSIHPQYCIAVDVVNGISVNYDSILKGETSTVLNSTLDDMSKLI